MIPSQHLDRNQAGDTSAPPVCVKSCSCNPVESTRPIYRSTLCMYLISVKCYSQNRNIQTLIMQEWDAEAFPDSSKNNTIKASSKLFLFHRLKNKKQKNINKSSPKNKHEASTEDSGPEPDTPPSPKVPLKHDSFEIVFVLFFCLSIARQYLVLNCYIGTFVFLEN